MAGTTPNFALPFPTGTDLVRDGDNAMQALAEAIDALLPRVAYGYVSLSGGGDVARVTLVTWPTGRFTSTPSVQLTSRTATNTASTTNTELWTQGPTAGGVQVAVNRSNSTAITVDYLAVQSGSGMAPALPAVMAAPADEPAVASRALADPLYTDTVYGPMLRPYLATCRTVGCFNEGSPITVDMGYLDEDGETVHEVDAIICGVCSQPITDLVPYTPDEPDEGGE